MELFELSRADVQNVLFGASSEALATKGGRRLEPYRNLQSPILGGGSPRNHCGTAVSATSATFATFFAKISSTQILVQRVTIPTTFIISL